MGKKNVVVLGGGISGLTAAYTLTKKGFNVTVIEKNDFLGGLAATFAYKNYLLDYGPHNFHTHIPDVLKFVKDELGVPLERMDITSSKMFFMGKFVDYPIKIVNALKNLNCWVGVRCLYDYILSRITLKFRSVKDEDSFEDWVKAHFGKYLYNLYFGPYVKKVWGIPASELDAIVARKRIPIPSLFSLIMRIFTGIKIGKKHSEDPGVIESYYPHKGIGSISDRLAECIRLDNGKIELNCKVNSIVLSKDKTKKSYILYSHEGLNKKQEWDYLINTTPVDSFVPLISATDIDDIKSASALLSYRAIILLYMFFDIEKVFDSPWIYFNDGNNPLLIFNRLSEIVNFSRQMSSDNKSCLCFEITCYKGDQTWQKSEQELFEICISYLEKNHLLKREHVKEIMVKRVETAYPVFRRNYQASLAKVVDYFLNEGNIFSIGRQGLFSYANIDHCISMGLKLGLLIKDGNLEPKDFYRYYNDYIK